MARSEKRNASRIPKKIIAGALSLVFSALFFTTQPAQPFRPLPVPRVAQTRYSGPFLSPTFSTSVLGAETIDPIDIVRFINEERQKIGSPPLRVSRTLTKAAQKRAEVILKYQNFSHHDPYENIELSTVLPLFGYRFAYASENIGMGDSTARAFVNGFMSSTSHRENLLDPRLTDTGVAVVTGPYHQYFVNIAVQIFAIPGGEEEFLGYSQDEKITYAQTKRDINVRLFKTQLYKSIHFFDDPYRFDNEIQYLTRQLDIIEQLLQVMDENKPFTTEHVLMIQEFNANVVELNSLG